MTSLQVLVTGGAGFIGSNVANRLVRAGHDVTVCDWFGTGPKWRNIASTDLAGVLLPDDLPAALQRRRFDVVVHMGAISATTESDVDLIVRTNLALSERLLDFCTEHGARFIYASSAATYGDGEAGFQDDDSPEALAALRPLNAYGWSKALFDQIVVRRRTRGAPLPSQWAGLKFFNVFGPNEYHKDDMRSVVHKVHGQIRDGRPVTLFKSYRAGIPDGGQERDFIYVDDCVSVIEWLIASPDVTGLFNVGTGRARSFHDLGLAVFRALEREPDITFVEMPETLRARYQYYTQASVGKLRLAGYGQAFTTLEDAVSSYVRHYLEADNPYR